MVFMSQPRPPIAQLRHPAHGGFFDKPFQRRVTVFGIAAIGIWVDYITGPTILFPIWFALPVIISAWFDDFGQGLFYAVILPVCRVGLKYLWKDAAPWPWSLFFTNCIIRSSALALLAYFVAQTSQLTREVKVLQGLIPICFTCRRMHTPEGQWVRLESYLDKYSEAMLTHGICPECLAKSS
jgi:hypothetical protein